MGMGCDFALCVSWGTLVVCNNLEVWCGNLRPLLNDGSLNILVVLSLNNMDGHFFVFKRKKTRGLVSKYVTNIFPPRREKAANGGTWGILSVCLENKTRFQIIWKTKYPSMNLKVRHMI